MRIQEVVCITGLSRKAINLYEKKGLLHIARDESGYRCYTQEHVRMLMLIKILRRMDVSLADMQLLLQEKKLQLLDTQKEQLEKSSRNVSCKIFIWKKLQDFWRRRIQSFSRL